MEAYAEKSKEKLLHAILLDPSVDSYSRAVQMMDEMLERQKGKSCPSFGDCTDRVRHEYSVPDPDVCTVRAVRLRTAKLRDS